MNLFKKSPIPPHESPIDREGRDRMADALDSFLNRVMDSCELDERINAITSNSSDPTLGFVALEIDTIADDSELDIAYLDRVEWNHLYRLLLLLRSNGQVDLDKHWRWTAVQFLATPLAGFYIALLFMGGGDALILSAPLSLVLLPCAFYMVARQERDADGTIAVKPFASMSEIMKARRSVPDFKKVAYSKRLLNDCPEPRCGIVAFCLQWFFFAVLTIPIMVIFMPPLLFFVLAFPYTQTKSRVVFPA